jgi:hypothetical protein
MKNMSKRGEASPLTPRQIGTEEENGEEYGREERKKRRVRERRKKSTKGGDILFIYY